MLSGIQINIWMMIFAEIIVLFAALFVAIIRTARPRSRTGAGPGGRLTDFFRGTPIAIVALLISVGFPTLGYHFRLPRDRPQVLDDRDRTDLGGDDQFYGIWALALVYTAYVTEDSAPASRGCTRASAWPRARSASTTSSRCATSWCRRPCAR